VIKIIYKLWKRISWLIFIFPVTQLFLFNSHSQSTGKRIGEEGAIKLAEALKSNTSLTTLNLFCIHTVSDLFFSLDTDNSIGTEGSIRIIKALKLNSSITDLYLTSNFLLHFILAHSIQVMRWAIKVQSNYLKCSNATHLSHISCSAVINFYFISFSSNTANNISNEGAIKLFEALQSNSTLTSLDLYSNTCCFVSFSLNTDNKIGSEGAIKLSEVLKLNTSLTLLMLGSNRIIAPLHPHSIQ
jgi:hypothetical protein